MEHWGVLESFHSGLGVGQTCWKATMLCVQVRHLEFIRAVDGVFGAAALKLEHMASRDLDDLHIDCSVWSSEPFLGSV